MANMTSYEGTLNMPSRENKYPANGKLLATLIFMIEIANTFEKAVARAMKETTQGFKTIIISWRWRLLCRIIRTLLSIQIERMDQGFVSELFSI